MHIANYPFVRSFRADICSRGKFLFPPEKCRRLLPTSTRSLKGIFLIQNVWEGRELPEKQKKWTEYGNWQSHQCLETRLLGSLGWKLQITRPLWYNNLWRIWRLLAAESVTHQCLYLSILPKTLRNAPRCLYAWYDSISQDPRVGDTSWTRCRAASVSFRLWSPTYGRRSRWMDLIHSCISGGLKLVFFTQSVQLTLLECWCYRIRKNLFGKLLVTIKHEATKVS